MSYRRVFILVEGEDDEIFVKTIIKPKLENHYDMVILYPCAQIKDEKIINFIKSIKSMKADYIALFDYNRAPCKTFRKEKIINRYKELCEEKVALVIKEIESWYAAGLNETFSKKFLKRFFNSTDNLTKEEFNRNISTRFESRKDFMIEILKHFNFSEAMKKNQSFNYFINRYLYQKKS